MVEISDAGAVSIQRCVSPTVAVTATGPVDCAAMYADSFHIVTRTRAQRDATTNLIEDGGDRLRNEGSSQREASVTLGSSVWHACLSPLSVLPSSSVEV